MIKTFQWTSLYFLTLTLLFLVSCDGKNNDTKLKIEENTSFKPVCRLLNYSIKCSKGQPACGSKHGEYQLKVHCIDGDGIILSDGTAFCEHNETKQPGSETPSCYKLSDSQENNDPHDDEETPTPDDYPEPVQPEELEH